MLRIKPDGSLRLVSHGVVSSGGVLPVSVAIHDGLVYVANSGNGGSNYTGFRLRPNGRLQPIAGSTVALPDGSQPGDVLFSGDGAKLPFPAQGLGPFGSEFRPANPHQLFVSNAHNAGRQRHRLGVPRLRQRDAVADRILPVRRPADGSVLGGDHP